jgi:hypothetical protein
LEDMKRERAYAKVDRPARPAADRGVAETGRDLISAMQDLFKQQIDQQGIAPDKSAENDLQRAMQAAQNAQQQENRPAPRTESENLANPIDPDVPLQREGERDVTSGQGEGGNSNVGDGAMGQHVTQSAAGEGGNPSDAEQSKSQANLAAAPVAGPKTMRLEAQLQRVRIESESEEQEAGKDAEERLYAATRAQRSMLDYQAVANQPRYTKEEATSGERVPLAHRAVVKDYFLHLRQTEK